jgi:hypothetical protein
LKLWILLSLPLALLAAAAQTVQHSADFHAFLQKVAYLRSNGASQHPDPKPVELTEAEANAFFNEGGVRLPVGVSKVRLAAHPGQIDGHAQVDFDQIMQRRGVNNPLAGMFTGQHDVHAVSDARGANGAGTIHIQSVELDGVQIPQFALEWFLERYVAPRYPNVGMTTSFKLPLHIDSAVIESGKVRLQQH